MNSIEKEVVAVIAQESGIDESEVSLDSTLYDLGIDSLSTLEILVALENKYDIRIPERELRDINTVREIARIISEKSGCRKFFLGARIIKVFRKFFLKRRY